MSVERIAIRTGLLALLSVTALARCASPLDASQQGVDTTSETLNSTSGTKIVWSKTSDSINSGRITRAAPTAGGGGADGVGLTALESSGTEANFPTCFDNSRNCRHAAPEVQREVNNNPVLIQSFQLNFGYQNLENGSGSNFSSVVLDGASVTTAELRFNSTSGALQLGSFVTRNLQGSCDLSNTNSVGYSSTETTPKVLVGFAFYEEATLQTSSTNQYLNALLSSGRVWHSGLYPAGSASSLAFRFSPESQMAYADFGNNDFIETSTTGSVLVSPKFEASSNTPNSASHVIVGFCIQGHKVKSDGSSRPLFYGATVYLNNPNLSKIQ